MMTTLADYVGPEFRMDMIRAFGSDAVIPASPEGAAGYDADDEAQRSCGDLWRPNGHIESAYYIPDDYDTPLELCSIDEPPTI